jgi:ABC-type phosphate transport system substrate-binding protein
MFILNRGRPRPGRRRWALLASAILLIAAFAAVDAGPAVALGAQCSGSGAQGKGAFLQRRAQLRWSSGNELGFNGSPSALACNGSQGSGGRPEVSYALSSSAAALHLWGADDAVLHEKVDFLGTDIAPSGPVGEEGTMLARMKAALGSDLVVVPVTQTAIAIVANPPALPGHPVCSVPRISASQLQKVFSGEIKNWRQIGTASDTALGGDCDQAITRVAREESAGTTYQFKHYLSQVNSAALPCTGGTQRNWTQLQAPFGGETPANVEWPRNSQCQEGEGPVTAVAVKGEGEAGALQFVASTRGTITYASLPEAEDKAPEQVIEVNNGAKYVEPDTESGAANCSSAKYSLPEGAAGGLNVDWSQVYGSDPAIGEKSKTAYPICTLTWDLVPANAAGLFGGKVATTLRDYLRFVIAPEGGQPSVRNIGYQDLPANVREAAAAAVNQIGGEEKPEEEEKEEEPKEEPPLSGTGTVLCRTQPEEGGGMLFCPPGEGFSGGILGQLAPKTTATFEFPGAGEEGTIACEGGHFYGTFEEDGTSSGSGLQYLVFDYCNNPFWGSPEAKVALENTPYDAARFVYLGTLAPQGAFVVAKGGGGQVLLRVYGSGGPCTYLPTFLSGQTVNGVLEKSPTELIMQGRWQLAEGPEEECPPQLQQSAQLTLTGSEEGPLFVAGE